MDDSLSRSSIDVHHQDSKGLLSFYMGPSFWQPLSEIGWNPMDDDDDD